MEILNSIASNIPVEGIIAAGLLSPVMAGVIKLVKAQRDITKLALVFIGGTLVALANYLINTPTSDPTIVYIQGAMLTLGAQPFWYLLVKPGFHAIGVKLAQAEAFKLQAQSAAIPETGLPISTQIASPATDFSR